MFNSVKFKLSNVTPRCHGNIPNKWPLLSASIPSVTHANMSLDKKLTEVFTLFQDKDKNVVSVKDIPTIIRALGKVY